MRKRVVVGDEAQVAHVFQIVGVVARLLASAQQRLDDAAHARFPELVGELVEVDLPAQDEVLSGVEEVVAGDRTGTVPARIGVEAGAAAERVHQPGLAPGLGPHRLQRLRGEGLPGFRAVLGEQRAYLRLREVPEAQRFRPDVERAAAGDRRVLRAGMDTVVAHVAHPAQHHALRKAPGALVVAGAQLPQHGDQGVADQGVELIDQQHQGFRVGLAPAGQRLAEGAAAEGGQGVDPGFVQERVARRARPRGQRAQDHAHGALHVLAHRLRGLDVHVHAAEIARRAAVEQVLQGEESGGLARLPGGVQHEVPLVPDQLEDPAEIHPFQRRDAVVVRWNDGAFGVEFAHEPEYDEGEWKR